MLRMGEVLVKKRSGGRRRMEVRGVVGNRVTLVTLAKERAASVRSVVLTLEKDGLPEGWAKEART